MRKFSGLLALVTALLLLCSCSVQPISEEKQISFTDSMNHLVSLDKTPETVAVLFSSYAEIWNLAGGTVSVTVGESVERGFAPQETPLVDDGAGKTIDMELLLAAQPDFVIGSADIDAQVEACGLLRQAGIPAALFRVDTFSDYLSMLKICTQITGDAQAYPPPRPNGHPTILFASCWTSWAHITLPMRQKYCWTAFRWRKSCCRIPTIFS